MFVELLTSSSSMFTKSDYLKSQNLEFCSHPIVILNSVAVALFTNRFFVGIRLLATSYGIKTMQLNTKPIPSKIDESLIHHCLHYCDILCFRSCQQIYIFKTAGLQVCSTDAVHS